MISLYFCISNKESALIQKKGPWEVWSIKSTISRDLGMILCVGALGAGKSTLLRVLHQHGLDAGAATMSPDFVIPTTTPTVGTDILALSKGPRY